MNEVTNEKKISHLLNKIENYIHDYYHIDKVYSCTDFLIKESELEEISENYKKK